MSNSKTLTIALVICLVAVYTYLLNDYLTQEKAQTAVTNQANDSARALALLARPSESLDKRLAEMKLSNQLAVQSVTLSKNGTTEIIDSILQAADDCNLKVDPVTTNQWQKKSVGTSSYRLLPIVLIIKGNISDLTMFIQKLDNRSLFPSLAIENLSINWNSQTDANTAILNASSSLSVKLTVDIITRLEAGK